MPKRATWLYRSFQPEEYRLTLDGNKCWLVITGRKLPPPSKRISLHQKGLKITGAKITRLDKKGSTEYEVVRINHLPTFEQVRLHTKEILFPGYYEIAISFSPKPKPKSKLPKRQLFPCIDEPEAWDNANFEIK